MSNQCQNGATCKDLLNDFECCCPDGFSGNLCETNDSKDSFHNYYPINKTWMKAKIIYIIRMISMIYQRDNYKKIQQLKHFW